MRRAPRSRVQPFRRQRRQAAPPPARSAATRRRPPPAPGHAPATPARCRTSALSSKTLNVSMVPAKAADPPQSRKQRLGDPDLVAELVTEIGSGDGISWGGRSTGTCVGDRCRRIRSTSARISARSASIRSSERSSSTTAAGRVDRRRVGGADAGACRRLGGRGSGTITAVLPRSRRGSSTKVHSSATSASTIRSACAASDSAVG